MSSVFIVDTSVLLNVLDVPGFNQNRQAVLDEFRSEIEFETSFLLPFCAVIESGNHISRLNDGRLRRRFSEGLRDQVVAAIEGRAPWQPFAFPEREDLLNWLSNFPDECMRDLSLADVSIKHAWEISCSRFAARRVRVWALDDHLAGLDRLPPVPRDGRRRR